MEHKMLYKLKEFNFYSFGEVYESMPIKSYLVQLK